MIEKFDGLEIEIIQAETTNDRGPGIQKTKAAHAKLPELKKVIPKIANGLAENLHDLAGEIAPDEVDLTLSLTAGAKTWIIGLEGKGSVQLTLRWKNISPRNSKGEDI